MIENREYSKKELARLYSPNTKKVKSAMKSRGIKPNALES